jgi:hypothetical protein
MRKRNLLISLFCLSLISVFAQVKVTIDINKKTLEAQEEFPVDKKVVFKCENCSDIKVKVNNQENMMGFLVTMKSENDDVAVTKNSQTLFIGKIRFKVEVKPVKEPLQFNKVALTKIKRKSLITDALRLDSLWKQKDYCGFNDLLEVYGIGIERNDIVHLRNYKNRCENTKTKEDNAGAQSKESLADGQSPFSILNPTMVIDALAQFAVKRFKQELTLAYLNEFRDTLRSPRMMPLRTFLPSTSRVLIEDDIFNYTAYLTALRENAVNDMNDLPINAKTFLLDYNPDGIDNADWEKTKPILLSSCDLIQSMRLGLSSAETINFLSIQDYVSDAPKTGYAKVIRSIGALSRALLADTDKPTPTGWAESDKLSKVFFQVETYQLWMALMLKTEGEVLKNIEIEGANKNLYNLLNMEIDSVFPKKIRTLISHTNRIIVSSKDLQNANDSVKQIAYDNLSNTMADFLGEAYVVFTSKDNNTAFFKQSFHTASRLEQSLRKKRYGAAVTNLIALVNPFYDNNSPKWVKMLNKYGNFLVNCINAQDGKELAEVLDAMALPVQSYRIKRQRQSINYSINMYAGGSLGFEWSRDSLGKTGKGDFILTPTVPVGIGCNLGLKNGGTFSTFVSIIDIGAVAVYRFSDNVSQLPELEWSNIIAPGLHIMYGFKKTPLTLSLGIQLGPNLRKITTDNTTFTRGNHRIGVGVLVDIPLFYFK